VCTPESDIEASTEGASAAGGVGEGERQGSLDGDRLKVK